MDQTEYPIFFLTGVSYAKTQEEQNRWQELHDRNVSRLMESLRKRTRGKNNPVRHASVSSFIDHNPFLMTPQ